MTQRRMLQDQYRILYKSWNVGDIIKLQYLVNIDKPIFVFGKPVCQLVSNVASGPRVAGFNSQLGFVFTLFVIQLFHNELFNFLSSVYKFS